MNRRTKQFGQSRELTSGDTCPNCTDQTVTSVQGGGSEQKGASMIEYAMLAMLIAMVCAVSISIIGNEANRPYSTVASAMALG